MRNNVTAYLDNAITILLFLVAGATPLLFLSQTTEFYEMPKLAFLVISTLLLLGLWIFSWIVKGKIVINRTPLDIPLLVLLGVVVASTYFNASSYSAVYGNFPRVHGSAVAWVTYILLYFVTVSHLKNLTRVKAFLYVLYGSGAIVALLTVTSYFGLFLPFNFTKSVTFTPTGSSFSTIAFLLLLLPLPLLSLGKKNNFFPLPVAVVLATVFSVTVALISSLPSLLALLATYVLVLFVAQGHKAKKALGLLLVPAGVTILFLALSYLPFKLPAGLNTLQTLSTNFPREIQLPFATSWKITASAFRDAPFFGTGPSSYLFNFTSYKPAEFNLLNIWNFSFDTAYNEFLQVLGTIGLFGLLALVAVCLVVLNNSRKNLSIHAHDVNDESSHVLVPALTISGLMTIVLLAIHSTTLVSIVVSFFMFAALMMSQKAVRERVMELSMGLRASTSSRQFDLLPVIIFIIFLVGAVPAAFKIYNVVAADYYHRLALSQANTNGTLTYQYLQRAEAMNPYVDLYRVDLAQTNFALANAIVARANTNASSPSAALSDADKRTIQTLLSQSINEGRASVALSPRSSRNWEVLAAIYRNITGVAQNALTFSLDAYGRAIQRDPLNPVLRLNVGGIYYSVRNYDLAIRFFTDAANLKPDYANAYFNLAIALREKGDLQNAGLVAQQTVALLQKSQNTQDLKTANALLADLKAKIATGSANTTGQAAPAAQTNSALNNNVTGVDVNNLNNPPSVTPAPSVKPNPSAALPQISPTRTVSPTPAQ
jgi:tetratricopeptide (TPR) repeat protein